MLASAQWRTVIGAAVPRVGSKPGLPPSVCVLPTVLRSGYGQGAAASSRGRGLADRRAPRVGREEILCRQLGRRNGPPQLSCDDQGTMDLRAGPSTVEGGTRARPLRGKVLARPSSSCADGDDCLRVPPTSPAQKSEAGKKNQRPAPSTDIAGGSPRHRRPHHAIKSSAMSVLPILDQRGKQHEWLPKFEAGHVNGTCRIVYRQQLKTCWPVRSGEL